MSEGDLIKTSSLYKDKEEWKDVKPIYPNAAELGVVRIAASEDFTDAFAYLRAVLVKKELSERCFQLTNDCIQLNPANYTLWQYRRDLIRSLNKNLSIELRYIGDIITENPKNYQVWHHRRAIIEWMDAPGQEMCFSADVLEEEPKNYHAWQHRQWVVRRFKLAGQPEIDFSTKLILEDPRNNSAWNYRYFILQSLCALENKEQLDIEINLCKQLSSRMVHNESVWNYLTGLLVDGGILSREDVVVFVEELYSNTDRDKRSSYMVSFLVDILIEKIEKGLDGLDNTTRAKLLLDELIESDPVRANFWNYQKIQVENILEKQLLDSKQF